MHAKNEKGLGQTNVLEASLVGGGPAGDGFHQLESGDAGKGQLFFGSELGAFKGGRQSGFLQNQFKIIKGKSIFFGISGLVAENVILFVEKGKPNGKFAQSLHGHHSRGRSVGEKIGALIKGKLKNGHIAVSYTHLTLPTIYSV